MAARRRLLALPFALVLAAGCHVNVVTSEPAPIVLAAVYDLSGGAVELDRPSAQGARLAVAERNRGGGLLGRSVQLVIEDGGGDAEGVAHRTADLLDRLPATSALFGLSQDDLVVAAAGVAALRQRLFVTSGASSPRLPSLVREWLFLACYGDNVQAAAGAEWAARDLSARTAAVVYDASQGRTRLLHGYFQTRFTELGGSVRAVRSFEPGDLSSIAARLPRTDFVFLAAGDPETALSAALRLREAGVRAPILGGDGFDALDPWSEHPELRDVYFTAHAYLGADSGNPRVTAFRESYARAFPESAPDAFAALGYDTARLVMASIARAGSSEPDDVRRALAGTRDFEGVTGRIAYPEGSRIPLKSVAVVAIDAGRRRLVRELLPVRVPPP